MPETAERRRDYASAIGFLVFATLCGPGLLMSPLLLLSFAGGGEAFLGILTLVYGFGAPPAFVFGLATLYPVARDGYATMKAIAIGASVGTLPLLVFAFWGERARFLAPDLAFLTDVGSAIQGALIFNLLGGALSAWAAGKLGIFVSDPRQPPQTFDSPEPFEGGITTP